MDKKRQSLAVLDTHIIVWLYDALLDRLSQKAQLVLEESDLFYSPISVLELHYLYEIKRIRTTPKKIIEFLETQIGLRADASDFHDIVMAAMDISWTRDVFDRIIVATAKYKSAYLVTADRLVQDKYVLSII